VLAKKGAETVKLRAKPSEKTFFNALGATSTTGQKLSLWILAMGETYRCERKSEAHPGIMV
jgi:hypothetical protein